MNGGDPRGFSWVKPDVLSLDVYNISPSSLPFVSADGEGDSSVEEFLSRRIDGIAHSAPTNADFVGLGYQDVLEAVAGTYALAQEGNAVEGGLKALAEQDTSGNLAESLALGYLCYASARLQEEGRAGNDAEAVAILIADLFSYINGEEMAFVTVDDFVVGAARIVAQHRDAPLVQSIMKKAAEAIVDGSSSTSEAAVAELLGGFSPNFKYTTYILSGSAKRKTMMQDVLTCYLAACYEGPQPGTSAAKKYPDAFSARKAVLYNDNLLAAASLMGVDADVLKGYLGTNASGQVDGSRPFVELVQMGLGALLSQKDEDGIVVQYSSLDEVSNVLFERGIRTICAKVQAQEELVGYLDILASHPAQAKDLLFNMLFSVEGQPFSTNYNLVVFCTLLYNADVLVTSHYGEVYAAWARAVRKIGLGDYDHGVLPPRTQINVPTAQDRTYNGKSQAGVAKGDGYVVTGTRTATNAGTYVAYATPNDGYCWPDGTTEKKKLTWKIAAKAVTPTVTLAATSYEYDGAAKTPAVTVKVGKTTLAKGTDYTVKYDSGRKDPGTYAAKVTLKGNYSGSKTAKFKVVEAHSLVREDVATLSGTVTMYLPSKGSQTDARVYTYKNGKLKGLASGNNKIVSCSASGGLITLTALKQGATTVTYTYQGKKRSAKLVVGKYVCPVAKLTVGSSNITSKFSSAMAYDTSIAKLRGQKIQVLAKKGWTLVGIYAATKSVEKKVANGGTIPKDTNADITITLQNKSTKGYVHLLIGKRG